jgi:hypothetical protein
MAIAILHRPFLPILFDQPWRCGARAGAGIPDEVGLVPIQQGEMRPMPGLRVATDQLPGLESGDSPKIIEFPGEQRHRHRRNSLARQRA